jgi:hypothetical protein
MVLYDTEDLNWVKPVCVGQVWSKNEWVWFCNPVASIAWFKTHLQAMEVLDKYLVENEYYLIAENELQRFEKIMLLI